MPRWSAGSSDRFVLATGVLALLALLSVVLPGIAVAQEPPEDTPPIVSNVSATPNSLDYLGGQVTITADVIDDIGATMVYAELSESSSSPQYVQLTPSQIHPSGAITYSGSIVLGPNHTDTPVSYGVLVQATDGSGGTGEAFGGEVTVDAQPQFDEPPTVTDPSVDPSELGSAGGPVTIGANAYDLRGISEIYATITPAAGGTSYLPLEGVSSSRYEGVLTVPPNTGLAPVQYAVEISALDDIGQQTTVDAGIITVAAPPIVQGRLTLSPSPLSFALTPTGRRMRRTFVLRNPGRRSSPAIPGCSSRRRRPSRWWGQARRASPSASGAASARSSASSIAPRARAGTRGRSPCSAPTAASRGWRCGSPGGRSG